MKLFDWGIFQQNGAVSKCSGHVYSYIHATGVNATDGCGALAQMTEDSNPQGLHLSQ